MVVHYGDDALELESPTPARGDANGGGGGHGLVGMRERVAVFGGELESGPRAEGGFAVRAACRLPL